MKLPWREAAPLAPELFAGIRRQAVFDCCKWDPQVEDVESLSAIPLVLQPEAWDEIAALAERLAAEAMAAEAELAARPALHKLLGLPRRVRAALARAAAAPSQGAARVLRFDFHATTEGWRISEANTDVPGGFNEASGFTRLVSAHVPGTVPAGDPAGRLADAVAAAVADVPPGAAVALVHATAFTDDRQVMVFLGRHLEARGCRPLLLGPDHLRWRDGRAFAAGAGCEGPIDFLVRFFPAEWLPNLPRRSGWRHFFAGAATPASNPAAALLVQSKRFPLVWDRLETPLPTWRALLPETVDPREAGWRRGGLDGWVVKPALGRVGDGIGLTGVTGAKEWKAIDKDIRRHPAHWAAQRRFEAVPLATPQGPLFPCVGVYTIDGRAAGAYGRVAGKPLVDHLAQDAAVLVAAREQEAAA
jgi:glutathionylspermidine synthase